MNSPQDTSDQDKAIDEIFSENFYYKIQNGEKEVHLNRKKAKAKLKALLVEAHLNERIEAYDEIYNLHMSQEWDTNSEDLSRFLQRYLHNTLVFKTRLAQLKAKGGDV